MNEGELDHWQHESLHPGVEEVGILDEEGEVVRLLLRSSGVLEQLCRPPDVTQLVDGSQGVSLLHAQNPAVINICPIMHMHVA